MLTVCPKCALTLAVTAADLRLGQGYVRCGRCSDVFNALLTLRDATVADTSSTQPQPVLKIDAVPAELPLPEDRRAEPRLPEIPAPEPNSPEQHSPEHLSAEEPLPAQPAMAEHSAPEAEQPRVQWQREELPADEYEVVIDTAVEPLPQPWPAPPPAAVVALVDLPEAAVAEVPLAEVPAPVAPAAEPPEPDDIAATEITAVQFEAPPPAVDRRRFHAQAAGIALAALLLLGQCINQWRDSIASHPRWYPLMDRVYSAFGVQLTPEWQLDGYDLRQLGTASYGGGDQTLWIRLQLGNRGARAVPWPQLRVSLSDRYGKHLASRVLRPADYLTRTHGAERLMRPAQRIETEVGVNSPAAATSSFELDVCLPAAAGVRCANDEVLGPPARS
jgi:predicted Zn finger-like uncharacterized protein